MTNMFINSAVLILLIGIFGKVSATIGNDPFDYEESVDLHSGSDSDGLVSTTEQTTNSTESCSRNITVNSTSYQTFQSPGYPTGYPNNLDCLYTLTAPPGYQIKVELEGYLEDDYDFLSVVEPNVTRKELTGNFQFEILTSINNSLQIRFTSDGSISENGFRAKYKLFQKPMFTLTPTTASAQDLNNSSNINMTTNPTVAIPESCSRNITVNSTSYQTFQSPGYPTGYPNNLDCLYTLTAPPGYQIKVELEGYLEDGYDFLSIIGGPRFSGRIFYETFTATNNSLQLLFTSDSSISRVGFRARYKLYDKSMFTFPQTTTAAPCGGSFNVTGTHFMNITSPGYPNNYQNNLKCEYIFETQLGYRIEIEIEGIIEDGFDYLQIVDNKTSEFTGEIKNFSITSSSNILKITFLTDETVGKMGFVINYRKVTVTSARPTTTSELSLSCPNTTSCNSKRAVWLCEYIRWRIEFLKNWQKQFEDWRSRFNPEVRTGPYHAQDENDCLSLNISCINPSQRRFTSDYYGCAIQYCADGLYKNGPGMEQWLIDQQHWRSVYELWKNAVANYPEEKCS